MEVEIKQSKNKYNLWIWIISIVVPVAVAVLFTVRIPGVERMGFLPPIYATINALTAVILIPLTFWFVDQCVLLSNYEYDQIKSFFFSKINASLFFVLIIAMLYHAKLGNETIVEDYVTSVNLKKITKLSISVLTYSCMILTTISLFYIVSS